MKKEKPLLVFLIISLLAFAWSAMFYLTGQCLCVVQPTSTILSAFLSVIFLFFSILFGGLLLIKRVKYRSDIRAGSPLMLLVLLAAFLLTALYFLWVRPDHYLTDMWRNRSLSTFESGDSSPVYIKTPTLSVGSLECHISSEYYVVAESSRYTETPNIIVKYKSSPDDNFDCAYEVGVNDFEIASSFFLALTDKFLLVGEDAYAGRGKLVVYDLEKREVVFTDRQVDLSSVENGEIAGGTITYLSVATDIEPSAEVCAEFESIRESGLAVIVLTEITVDLESGEVNDPGVFTCRGAM